MSEKRNDIRNIAIIAHVDHGKTTLVDAMLSQSGTVVAAGSVQSDRVMDSGDIERERGITILAKNTAITLPQGKINIVDTPGHLDFGGEVERTLQMVEGIMLLVDAAEGPLPGTRFVLQKALELGLKPMVLINKVDRKDADIPRTEELIQDLFLELATCPSQLDFPVLYGSSKNGFASTDPTAQEGDMQPLFAAIFEHIPAPISLNPYLQVLITNLDYSDYLGRIGVGRVLSGEMKLGDEVVCCRGEDESRPVRITKLYQFNGLDRVEAESAKFGDIIAIAGLDDEITIGTTICNPEHPMPVNYVKIDEPTLSINISVNNSPFFGKEGKFLTSRQIRERLVKELKTNVALRIEDTESPETIKVSGRGQLHLGVLVETMRREGFELSLSAPRVIYRDIDGKRHEPVETLFLDIEVRHQGILMEILGTRKAIMQKLEPYGNEKVRLEFSIPARGLIGFRTQFVTETRGTGRLSHQFLDYEPYMGDIPRRTKGAMVSMEGGSTTNYALDGLAPRGTLFVTSGEDVYEGMIIGQNSRDNDLEVNPTRKKKLTNMRSSGADDAVQLAPPRVMTLEECMDWISDDELIEVTPESIRLRKRFLKANQRKRTK